MAGKLIVLFVIVLVVILIVYLFRENLVHMKKKVSDEVKTKKKAKEVEICNGVEIMIRPEKKKEYQHIDVRKSEFKIGSGEKNDLVIRSAKVEAQHAVLVKKLKNNRVFYELINYSKINPVEYYNKEENKYEYLAYKEGVALGARESFYIGDDKIVIKIPQSQHKASETEKLVHNNLVNNDKEEQEEMPSGTTRRISKRITTKAVSKCEL